MKLLLDTHTFLWFVNGDTSLSLNAKTLIEDLSNERLISIASLWEIAIKISVGKLTLNQTFDIFIPQELSKNDISLLDVSISHAAMVATLPFHHRDPFDRMLIAQAIVEHIPVISVDSIFDAYGVTRLW